MYEIVLYGEIPAKKNEKMPVKRKDGKVGLITKPDVSLAMDRIAMQIPGWARDLNLKHPDLDFYFTVARDNVDRDNIVSSVLDILWQYNVIVDDNVRNFNGTLTLYPANVGKEWITTIQIHYHDKKKP